MSSQRAAIFSSEIIACWAEVAIQCVEQMIQRLKDEDLTVLISWDDSLREFEFPVAYTGQFADNNLKIDS